jgi:hypothetical protein
LIASTKRILHTENAKNRRTIKRRLGDRKDDRSRVEVKNDSLCPVQGERKRERERGRVVW